MFQHILLPTDGSELSLRAVDMGIKLAKLCGARLYAIHVAKPFVAITYQVEMIEAPEALYTQEAIARAESYLDEVRRRAEAAGMACEGEYAFDHAPHEAIIASAAAHHCDLIVMASHGRTGVRRLLLGSETHKVLLGCDVPVLVCH
ncbi:universal stress protein [Frateuria defendens]|uniref:universal stress protein n=1 Tax=Frateuria defendens TaxID=2219559 RepID=UPI00066FCC2E|nr:universal stress protein [Frateuria defendens]